MTEQEFHKEILTRLDSIDAKVNPMYEVFSSVSGFQKISIQIMKTMGLIAIALGGLYAVIEFFRQIGKS